MRILSLLLLLLAPVSATALTYDEAFPNPPEYNDPAIMELLRSFNYQRGTLTLPGGQAELNVPEAYYYLNPKDAKTVLVEIWGNPEGDSLGMLFPTAYTPIDYDGWGMTISWDPSGYVKDDDASKIDYDELLTTMQRDTRDANKWRRENNYPEIQFVGWAAEPYYDVQSRKLHWARELEIGNSDVNTLNYYLRALGRRGVLELNFIADITQLDQITAAIPEVSAIISFKEGNRYQDFVPSMDTVAAVGIGGLIAGKVVAKTGFLLVALLFLKKFAVFILLPLAWVWKKVTGRGNS